MKVTYQFVTGNVEIEVADEWGEVLMEQDRLLRNSDRRETRRHKSLDRLANELGVQFAAENEKNDPDLESALQQLPQEQQELLRRVFFHGDTLAAIACEEGVSKMALTNRMRRAIASLEKNF